MATTTSTHATAYSAQPQPHGEQPATADNPTAPKQTLALDQLAAVRFVAQITLVQTLTAWSKTKWSEGRKLWYLWWLLASVEIIAINLWILIHSLPWPDWALEYLHRIDAAIAKGLEWIQDKIDWYWHPGSRVRSVTEWSGRWLLRMVYLLLLPLKLLKNLWTNTQASVEQNSEAKAGVLGVRRPCSESERVSETKSEEDVDEWEEEFWGDEECISDASDVVNLSETTTFSHNDGKGRSVTRVRKTATADGRLRAVMERRVNAQLKLMRKNSVRFSRGVLNYAEVIFGPRVRTWSDAVVSAWCSWAKEHELDEMVRAIKDEVLSRPYLARPLALLWAIVYNSVTFFYRILKGKKNRRTRLSRKESLRRRPASKPIPQETPVLPTTPGLKMSSEPTDDASVPSSSSYSSSSSSSSTGSPPGEREESFEGVQRKDGLGRTQELLLDSGVEGDETHSEVESDRVCSTILEEEEFSGEEAGGSAEDKNNSAEETRYEEETQSPLSSSPTSTSSVSSISKTKKKILRTSRHGDYTNGEPNSFPSKHKKRVTIR